MLTGLRRLTTTRLSHLTTTGLRRLTATGLTTPKGLPKKSLTPARNLSARNRTTTRDLTNTKNKVNSIINKIKNDKELQLINPKSAHGEIIHILAFRLPDNMKDDVLNLKDTKSIEKYLTQLKSSNKVIFSHPKPARKPNLWELDLNADQDYHNTTINQLNNLLRHHKDITRISQTNISMNRPLGNAAFLQHNYNPDFRTRYNGNTHSYLDTIKNFTDKHKHLFNKNYPEGYARYTLLLHTTRYFDDVSKEIIQAKSLEEIQRIAEKIPLGGFSHPIGRMESYYPPQTLTPEMLKFDKKIRDKFRAITK